MKNYSRGFEIFFYLIVYLKLFILEFLKIFNIIKIEIVVIE